MQINISNGELVDKVSILSIKLKKIKSKEKLFNVKKEFNLLYKKMILLGISKNSLLYKTLLQINETLWVIEDKIRLKELNKEFDDEFVQLARSVYIENDRRSEIKKQINLSTQSDLIEEKEYTLYNK
ncbi:MAG: DUF6165 family protein [Desulfobacterales bacterium]|nr:DUF6165 family protein [Desulfobacterales bacterium]